MTTMANELKQDVQEALARARERYVELIAQAASPEPRAADELWLLLPAMGLSVADFEAGAANVAEVAALEGQIVPREELDRLASVATQLREARDAQDADFARRIGTLQGELRDLTIDPLTGLMRPARVTPEQLRRGEELSDGIRRLQRERNDAMEDAGHQFVNAHAVYSGARDVTANAMARIEELRKATPEAFGVWPRMNVATMVAPQLHAIYAFAGAGRLA